MHHASIRGNNGIKTIPQEANAATGCYSPLRDQMGLHSSVPAELTTGSCSPNSYTIPDNRMLLS